MADVSNDQRAPAVASPLAGRVAIVTGASRGIGRAVALHLASLGANVVVNYASAADQADLVVSEINSSSTTTSPPRAIAVRADVSDPADVKALFDSAERAFSAAAGGGTTAAVHILVCSAGVLDSKHPTLAETAEEEWDRTFAVNARGTFLCCREAANRLARGGGGRIITMSTSLVGSLLPGTVAYTASKAAVETMTKILAKELRGTGITANSVAPGPVATELLFAGRSEEYIKRAAEASPFGRLGETRDIAPVVGFIATDASEWVNGQVIRVNGGYV